MVFVSSPYVRHGFSFEFLTIITLFYFYFLRTWSHGLRPGKLHTNVAVPPDIVWVPNKILDSLNSARNFATMKYLLLIISGGEKSHSLDIT